MTVNCVVLMRANDAFTESYYPSRLFVDVDCSRVPTFGPHVDEVGPMEADRRSLKCRTTSNNPRRYFNEEDPNPLHGFS